MTGSSRAPLTRAEAVGYAKNGCGRVWILANNRLRPLYYRAMHLTQAAQFVVAGSWRSIHARCWSLAIGSRTRRRAGTILSGCGGRKDFAARYVVGRITGLRSGVCVTAGGAVGRPP